MENAIFVTKSEIERFCEELLRQERSEGTVAQYQCSLLQLWRFLPENKQLCREQLMA